MEQLNLVQTLAVYAVPVILAITIHEAAHGFVARHFGDLTAYRLGRVSLNPLRHVDPFGTLILPLVILVTSKIASGSGFLFGWAKPVPVNYFALRRPKAHMLWVAAAGPAVNIVQALVWGGVLKLASLAAPGYFATPLGFVAIAGITVNLMLAILNLVPILPLDGGRIVFSLLPDSLAVPYGRLERFGLPLVLAFIYLESQLHFLEPVYDIAFEAIGQLFALG